MNKRRTQSPGLGEAQTLFQHAAPDHGAETLGQRIRRLRREAGYNQERLAEELGVQQSAVSNWENDKFVPTDPLLDAMASLFGINVAELRYGGPVTDAFSGGQPFEPRPAPQPAEMRKGMPVYGSARGGHGEEGWFEWNGQVVDRVTYPPALAHVHGAYALYVQGESMEPRYFEGELVYVNPARPPTSGCFVILQIRPEIEGQAVRALVKRLVRRTGEKVVVEQYNPRKTYDIPADRVLAIHRILNGEELF